MTVVSPNSLGGDVETNWFGALPDHWRVERAKWLFRKVARPVHEADEVITCFRDGVVTLRKNRRVRGFTESLEGAGYQGIRRGDLVIHSMDAFAGAVGVSDSDGKATGVYSVCEPSQTADPEYYKYVLREMARSGWILALAKGIRERSSDFRFAMFADQLLPVPPVEEQSLAARYLDRADRRIRRAIHAKQKLIALLNEQKQVVIHRAVTLGLDPAAQIRSLGSIPDFDVNAAWDVSRLWGIARVRTEKNEPELNLLSVFLGRGVIPYAEGGGQVHKPSLELSGYQVVHPGDLVLNNQQAWRGSVGVSEHHGIVSPAYVVLELGEALTSQFANYLFQSRALVSQFVTASKGVGDIQRDVHTPWLKNVRVPIPRPDEQRAIALHLDQELTQMSSEILRGDREIELLVEYRTRLIADVVTGKLDVRDASARLPDEVDEPEQLDEIDVEDSEASEDEELEAVEA